MKTYLVIGVYEDNHQRYADYFCADSPAQAEQLAQKEVESPLIIAAVMLDGNIVA